MLDGRIDYLIYPGQMKAIIWAKFIQVGVINTNLPLPILLWNDHHIYQPVWIFDFSDKSDCQFVNFHLDDLLHVQTKT